MKKSFDFSASLTEVDTILFMGIVQWKDEWWFSGIAFFEPYDPDIVLKEENSLQSKRKVNFLNYKNKNMDNLLDQQLDVFKKFNNGSQIAFMPSENIEDFIQDYVDYFNRSLNHSPKEITKANRKSQNDGFLGGGKESNFSEVSETGLVFFNPNGGIEIALDINSAFPLPNNPYFDSGNSDDDVMFLLVSDEFSTELALFCIDNCKNELSFFNEDAEKMYLKDIDFLLRFWKKESYFAEQAITLMEQEV